MKLWKYNSITGYYDLVKTIQIDEDAEKWLEIFVADEPLSQFVLSTIKPRNTVSKTNTEQSEVNIKI